MRYCACGFSTDDKEVSHYHSVGADHNIHYWVTMETPICPHSKYTDGHCAYPECGNSVNRCPRHAPYFEEVNQPCSVYYQNDPIIPPKEDEAPNFVDEDAILSTSVQIRGANSNNPYVFLALAQFLDLMNDPIYNFTAAKIHIDRDLKMRASDFWEVWAEDENGKRFEYAVFVDGENIIADGVN